MEHAARPATAFPTYEQLITRYDPEQSTVWYYLNPSPRPSFTPTLLTEIRDFQSRVADVLRDAQAAPPVDYIVLASARPAVFNLGGDLDLFASRIEQQDRDALTHYARLCIDAVWHNHVNLGAPSLTTISLVQGLALGGGFEAAISSNVVIAEKGARFSFPEILFNLFPGMGAVSLLSRRVGMVEALRCVKSGNEYSAAELHALGVVDVLAEPGEGVVAVNRYIREHRRKRNGLLAIRDAAAAVQPLRYEELENVVEIWVDAAMRIGPRDLKLMQRLAANQRRLAEEMASGDGDTGRMSANVVPLPRVQAANAAG